MASQVSKGHAKCHPVLVSTPNEHHFCYGVLVIIPNKHHSRGVTR
jgi:hypothetical protein